MLGEASRMETQEKVAVGVRRQSVWRTGRVEVADEAHRPSAGRIPF